MSVSTGRTICVHVMDDAVFERQRLISFLAGQPQLRASGSGVSIAEARCILGETQPDVVIVSPHHLDPSAASTVRAIRSLSHGARVIVLPDCANGKCTADCASAAAADACIPGRGNARRILDLLTEWFREAHLRVL